MDKNIYDDAEWVGKSIVDVCQSLGCPNAVDPATYYAAKFLEGTPSVVMSYEVFKKRWFLSREGLVLGVVPFIE